MKNGKKYLPENYINCSFVTPTEIQLCTLVKLQLRAAQDQFKGYTAKLFLKKSAHCFWTHACSVRLPAV